ncbi:MAG: hypothetical protein M5U34_20465 [Chloroflexi bacterium]|nr:hypothetical protein [Chloroflexota bacterium]
MALALGSLGLAWLNLWATPFVWWVTAVSGMALLLAAGGTGLRRFPRWRFLTAPFGHIALAVTVPVLLVGLAWTLLAGSESLAFYLSLAASWWLGGLTLLLMAGRMRMQTLVWATAVTFPIALWLTMRPLFLFLRLMRAGLAWVGCCWPLSTLAWLRSAVGWMMSSGRWRAERPLSWGRCWW